MTTRDPKSNDSEDREEPPEDLPEEQSEEQSEEAQVDSGDEAKESTDSEESSDDSEDSPEESRRAEPELIDEAEPPQPDPAAETPVAGPLRWLAPLLVAVMGLLVLLPGLSSFGLWEPPNKWTVTIQRKTTEEHNLGRRKTSRFDLPRSELRLAEQARKAVKPSPKRSDGDPSVDAKSGKAKPKAQPKAQDQPLPRRAPLAQALVRTGFRVFGVSEGAGRLPLALTGVLCLLCVFFLLRRLFGTWTGLLGAAVLLGLPAFVLHSRQLTSDIPTQLAGLLAVGGLGLACAPVVGNKRMLWLIPGVLGLLLGFYARGAVIGVLLPLVAVLMAVGLSYRLYFTPGSPASSGANGASGAGGDGPGPAAALRSSFWVQTGVLLGVAVILLIVAAVLLAALNPPRYSAFFGETPIAATKVMSYHGVKTPTHQLAVFDVMIKQLGYAAFPWIALLPLGLAFLLYPRGGSASSTLAAPRLTDEPARLALYGRLLLVAWLGVALVIGTYWVLRFGDLQFPALPAVAGIVAVLLVGLARERPGRRRMLGLAAMVVILAILVRDMLAFPETLVSSHISYRLQYPSDVSYKRLLYFIVVSFGMVGLALLVGRGLRSPVQWPTSMKEWFTSSQLGIGRWFGLSLDAPNPDAPNQTPKAELTASGILSGLLTIALLSAAGGGAAWALMKRPAPGLVVAAIFLTPLIIPLIPYFLATAVDLALFPFEAMWQVMTGRFWKGELFIWTRDEILVLGELFQRFISIHPLFIIVLILPALVVALTYVLRLFLRALILLAVLILLLPVTALSALRELGGSAKLPRAPVAAVGVMVVVPLILSCCLGWSIIPRLSEHYSYKAIIDTYNHSHSKKRPEPLGLFKVTSRSPVFYTKGPLLRGGELNKTYPRGRGGSTLLQFLDKGWTDSKGHHFDRVYAIAPVGELGKLDRDANAKDPAVPYYVLDARNSFYVLLSNRLGKKRVGSKLVAEKDLNPLRRMVMNEPPKIQCKKGGNMHCVRLNVRIAERKGASEPSLELIGAKFPKVVTPGKKFDVSLYFKVLKKIRGKYKVFLHIDGRGNRILGDHDPVGGKIQTSLWLPGRWVVDRYTVPASASSTVSTPSGWYIVYAGLFQGDRRMQVLAGPQDGQNRIRVGRLRVGRKIGCGCGGR